MEFKVFINDGSHPITQGIASFVIKDELYVNQEGETDIHVLYSAHSQITNQDEPMAWVSHYRSSRVYQTLLGHDRNAYLFEEVREMLRRGVIWSAQSEQSHTKERE